MFNRICKAFLFLIISVGTLFAAPDIPSNWQNKKPLDTSEYVFQIGMSEPCTSERTAREQAFGDAMRHFADSISAVFTGRTTSFNAESGYESEVQDGWSLTIESSEWKSSVLLRGATQLDERTERQSDGSVIVRVLVYMSRSDYERAKIAVQDEESAALAYLYFRKQADLPPIETDTYYQWLRTHCMIIQNESKQNDRLWAETFDTYLKKLLRNVKTYRCPMGGIESLIVLNEPECASVVYQSLNGIDGLSVTRSGSLFSVSATVQPSALANAAKQLRNPNQIVVFGREIFHLPSGDEYVNTENRVVQGFIKLSQKRFGYSASVGRGSFDSENEMIDYIRNHKSEYTARYAVFCLSETFYEDPSYYISESQVYGNAYFTIYDIETDSYRTSETAESMPGAFALQRVNDEQMKNKSRLVLDNISNADKNQEGLVMIMQKVFEE